MKRSIGLRDKTWLTTGEYLTFKQDLLYHINND